MTDSSFVDAMVDFNKPLEKELEDGEAQKGVPPEFLPEEFLKKYVFDKDPALDKVAPSNVERWSRGFGEGTRRLSRVFLVVPGEVNKDLDDLRSKLIDPAEPFLLVAEQTIPRKKAGDVMIVLDYLDITISKENEKKEQDAKGKENANEDNPTSTTDGEE